MTTAEPISVADRPGKTIASILGPQPGSTGPATPLAESALWERQRDFYTAGVPQIWGTATAPHAITANARIAHSYARIAAEFLRRATDPGATDVPHVVEVGGGSGRFAFLFIRALRALAPELAFRYVLTDFCTERIDTWRTHAGFASFVDDGVLDFAVLDADDAGPLHLAVSGRRLGEHSLQAPVVGIANYVFDTLRQDGCALRGGAISQLRLALDPSDAGIGHWEAAAGEAIADDLAPILEHYRTALDDTTVLVPVGGMSVLERLRALTSAPVCTLVADKGHARAVELGGQESPAIVWHGGAFSLMVNFDLLARWVRQRGGTATLPVDPARSLVVAAFVENDGDGRLAGLPEFVQDELLDTGPDNFFALRPVLARHPGATLDTMLATLRLSRFDPGMFVELFSALLATLPNLSERRRTEVDRVLRRVDANWFDIGEPIDMALCFGLAYGAMGRYDDAVRYLQSSVQASPDSADAALALAFAHRGRGDLREAMRWTERALGLQPGLAGARTLRLALADELGTD